MASTGPVLIEKPKLDLSHLRDDIHEGGIHKETSFVGELISFEGGLNTRRISDHRKRSTSLSSDDDGGPPDRRRSLRRSFSERDVLRLSSSRSPNKGRRTSTSLRNGGLDDDSGLSSRRKSLRRSSSVRDVLRLSSRSPNKGRRTSMSLRNETLDSPDGEVTARGRTTRRESMMNVLRQDLEKLPCLEAIKKRRVNRQESGDSENVFGESDTESGSVSPERTNRRSTRRQSTYRNDSRLSRTSISSYESVGEVLTEDELRKLKMIETLSKMGKLNHQSKSNQRRMSDLSASESSILEASFMRGKKRGSIATHILMTAKKRQDGYGPKNPSRPAVVIGKSIDAPIARPDSEILAEELKERAGRIFNSMKASGDTKLKFPSLFGKDPSGGKEDGGKESILGGFRRKIRRKRIKPIQVFRKKARFVLLLLRAWKIHSNAINESLVDNNDSLEMMTRANEQDLLFDITQYKASTEAKVSKEAVRILLKKPLERSEDEQHYIFLRNYKSIAEYPVKMQKMIAQRSWFESFDQKRVIVREGHIPMCFYFILSGSAVVSTSDNDTQRTVMFLKRGDSFGDIAILNKTRRQTTVISREKIELLCMTDTDFVDIFMSGGIRDPKDPFLMSIDFLDGWPREMLVDNPKKCIFSYFKRGTVLVNDSSANEWIFVVKSGSASILKKLTPCTKIRHPKVERKLEFREEVMELMKHERHLSHEEQIQLMYEEEKRSLDDQNLHVRFYALPEINVKTNEGYNELKQMKEEFINANSVTRALGDLEKMADDGVDIKSETGNSDSTLAPSMRKQSQSRRMSLTNVMLKGPYKQGLARENSFASTSSRRDSISRQSRKSGATEAKHAQDGVVNDIDHIQKVDDWQEMALPTVAESPVRDLTIRKEVEPVFVEIRALTKGQVFGMTELLYDGQPTLSLVSNGSECIMVEKKFFLEHASQDLIVRLRDNTYPYPSDEALQGNLESQIRWDAHKRRTVNGVLKAVESKKAETRDMREYLNLPPLRISRTF